MLRAPEFWKKRGLLSWIFLPFAVLYGWLAGYYIRLLSKKVSVPVICVGNIVVGGAGKTPAALFLARQLEKMGEKCFVLMRGFGGRLSGIHFVDVSRHDASLAGDEAIMMAAYVPVIIGKDRLAAARHAIEQGATIIVMDDGFQNPFLHKDFSFLVIDGFYGLGNGYVMPAGPLREKPQNAYARADAIMTIGAHKTDFSYDHLHPLPVFHAVMKPKEAVSFSGPLIAFAGIGHPEKFFTLLKEMNAHIVECHHFPDHHVFREKDADFLLRRADALGAQLITTEKDMARLSSVQPKKSEPQLAKLAQICHSLRVELVFGDEDIERIKAILKEVCQKR